MTGVEISLTFIASYYKKRTKGAILITAGGLGISIDGKLTLLLINVCIVSF